MPPFDFYAYANAGFRSISEFTDRVLHRVAPRSCPQCGKAAEGFCAACASLLEVLPEPTRQRALYQYAGPMQEAIVGWKYGGRYEWGPILQELFFVQLALAWRRRPSFFDVDLVMPMPLHARKLRMRGFNPAALLAQRAATTLAAALDVATLSRCRDTVPQASLARGDRQTNMRDAFFARPTTRGYRVLLVDDVVTTGATARAAVETLRAAGYSVRFIALAAALQNHEH